MKSYEALINNLYIQIAELHGEISTLEGKIRKIQDYLWIKDDVKTASPVPQKYLIIEKRK